MGSNNVLVLTHATLKTKAFIAAPLIAAWWHSPTHNCTHVMTSAGSSGAIIPVAESCEEIRALYAGLPAAGHVPAPTVQQPNS
jgi:hypothetical protein